MVLAGAVLMCAACGIATDPAYKRALELSKSVECNIPQGMTESKESKIYKNFMADDKDMINRFLEIYRKGTWLLGSPVDEVIQTRVRQFNEACASYLKIN